MGTASGQYRWVFDADEAAAATNRVELCCGELGQTYYFAVRARNHDRSLTSSFSNEVGITIGGPAIEANELQVDDAWQWVSFVEQFNDPIVVASTSSETSGDPSVIRITGVEPAGFWIRLQSWDYLQRAAQPERVGYVAMERGRHILSDGANVEAGRVVTDVTGQSQFTRVGFSRSFRTTPVVLTGLSSTDEWDAATTRIRGISGSAFLLGMIEQEANVQQHTTESIDYIAWEPSDGEVRGTRYLVGRTPDEVTEIARPIGFPGRFTGSPVVIAHIQTTNGVDPATVRWRNKTDDQVDFRIVEEQSLDAETRPAGESVGYLLLGW
ncbi:fibronectin type III domain-containing protein [Thiocapsa sp.]|uniref:fibronectin type III domain-containing protein n=1 Tax=Thiocapsa sp. TaxID=2024551 RepID=UPI00359419B9